MKHSKLVPFALLKKERLTITKIAQLTIDFYRNLSLDNDNYSKLKIVSEKKSLFENIQIQDSNAVEILAHEILHQNTDKIIEMDKVENPDINFIFKETFISYALQTRIDIDTLITLDFCFSVSKHLGSSIGSIVVNDECFNTFSKAKLFLETLETSFPTEYSVIKFSDREFSKIARVYKAPLGWITYFSKDSEISIPDDLEGIEYEHTDTGKYLILTREDFTTDKEIYDAHKQKLLDTMEEIKRRVPEYGK